MQTGPIAFWEGYAPAELSLSSAEPHPPTGTVTVTFPSGEITIHRGP